MEKRWTYSHDSTRRFKSCHSKPDCRYWPQGPHSWEGQDGLQGTIGLGMGKTRAMGTCSADRSFGNPNGDGHTFTAVCTRHSHYRKYHFVNHSAPRLDEHQETS